MNNGFDQSRRNLRCMGCNMNFMGQNARQFAFYEQSTAQFVDSLSYIFPDVESNFISCGFCKPGSQPETLPGRIVPADMPVLVENPKPAFDFKKIFEEAAEDFNLFWRLPRLVSKNKNLNQYIVRTVFVNDSMPINHGINKVNLISWRVVNIWYRKQIVKLVVKRWT